MGRKSSRVLVALAAVVATASMVGVGGASATSARLAGRRSSAVRAAKFSPAGSYEATVPAARITSHLVLTAGATTPNAGTFEFTDIGDYGDWVIQGRALAMQIASSVSNHAGIVLVARVTADGSITGYVGVPGYGETPWSATPSTATGAVAARAASVAADLQPPGNASGNYSVVFPDLPAVTDTLTLTHDRFSTRSGHLVFVNLADTGNWVQMGKKIAIGVSHGQDAGVTMIATRTTSGLDTAASPGIYLQPSSGVFTWYATKTS